MTEESFRVYLDQYVKEGRTFDAYWHPNGYALLVTDGKDRTDSKGRKKQKPVSASVRKRFYDKLLTLRKKRPFTGRILYFVYDGQTVTEQEV